MIGRIRLAWWRDRLIEIDGAIVHAEPNLEAAARIVAETALTGAILAGLAERWDPLLDDFPWESEVFGAIAGRGAILFGQAGLILGADYPGIVQASVAGSLWALLDVARHCSDADSRDVIFDVGTDFLDKFARGPVEMAVRPLTMLGLLARRDLKRWPRLEAEATPARAWVMIHHKLTGKL